MNISELNYTTASTLNGTDHHHFALWTDRVQLPGCPGVSIRR